MTTSTEDRIKTLLGKQFGVAPETLNMSAKLKTAYNADSLSAVEITIRIEDEFGIEIPDEDMITFTTGEEIVTYVSGKVAQ
jgi:acyl carrier protein